MPNPKHYPGENHGMLDHAGSLYANGWMVDPSLAFPVLSADGYPLLFDPHPKGNKAGDFGINPPYLADMPSVANDFSSSTGWYLPALPHQATISGGQLNAGSNSGGSNGSAIAHRGFIQHTGPPGWPELDPDIGTVWTVEADTVLDPVRYWTCPIGLMIARYDTAGGVGGAPTYPWFDFYIENNNNISVPPAEVEHYATLRTGSPGAGSVPTFSQTTLIPEPAANPTLTLAVQRVGIGVILRGYVDGVLVITSPTWATFAFGPTFGGYWGVINSLTTGVLASPRPSLTADEMRLNITETLTQFDDDDTIDDGDILDD